MTYVKYKAIGAVMRIKGKPIGQYFGTEGQIAMMKQKKEEQAKYGTGPQRGAPAPDTLLHDRAGNALQLLSLGKPGRPLILNFGSCS